MGSVVVCGGGVVGLAAAMMLARDGHEVTVLEADADRAPAAPAEAWEDWRRAGITQFRQPHNLFSRVREVCDGELPGMTGRLLDAGCVWVDPLATRPPALADWQPSPDDERFRFVTGRRPVVEAVFAAAAEATPGVTVRRGVRTAALRTGPAALDGVPHVTGVRTDDGAELTADLVVDATGRRSRSADWLSAAGARPPAPESQDSGFAYYTRYYTGPERPQRRAPGLTPMGSISVLTLDGDNDTWSVTLFGRTRDAPIKALRGSVAFERVMAACPRHAHWLDGRPITDVLVMAGVVDRYRSPVVDGTPVVTGLLTVGDAWACTNPSAGRGISLGMVHAQVLRRAVAAHLDRPAELAASFAAATEAEVEPFYRGQLAADRVRLAEMAAAGGDGPPVELRSPVVALLGAGMTDQVAFRAFVELLTCLATPQDVLSRPEVVAALDRHDGSPPPSAPGPDRARLLELLAT
ncbi:FAD-dependent oxidoreductase [Geodermatophilus sp. YIM 151500]|nr:FAD-dependent oxidoreductase [Geodermatophilus sp. YIM 151500]MCV2488363.1 FAD-dependent oxidoreductase [Geodermatophilus sp. YIM 151500]